MTLVTLVSSTVQVYSQALVCLVASCQDRHFGQCRLYVEDQGESYPHPSLPSQNPRHILRSSSLLPHPSLLLTQTKRNIC